VSESGHHTQAALPVFFRGRVTEPSSPPSSVAETRAKEIRNTWMLVRVRESSSKANELRVPPDVQTGWAAMIERRKRGGLAACTSGESTAAGENSSNNQANTSGRSGVSPEKASNVQPVNFAQNFGPSSFVLRTNLKSL